MRRKPHVSGQAPILLRPFPHSAEAMLEAGFDAHLVSVEGQNNVARRVIRDAWPARQGTPHPGRVSAWSNAKQRTFRGRLRYGT
jgi:hypothetical protein